MFFLQVSSLCKQKGITISELVRELGLATGSITGWKKGVVPKSDTVKRIADYFNVTTDYLLIGVPEKTPDVVNQVILMGRNGDKETRVLTDEQLELLLKVVNSVVDKNADKF